MKKILAVVLQFCLSFTYCNADSTIEDALDSELTKFIAKNHIPAMSVGIIDNGKIIYLAGFGVTDADGKQHAATENTLFRIASLTKLFTAQAIMQLVEKGKISLDDDVGLYIPELKGYGIKIIHLLTHTSGLKDKVWPAPFAERSFNKYLVEVLKVNTNITSGTGFEYSDTGFNILGEIIRRVSSQNYGEYIKKNILIPSHMKRTGLYSGKEGINPGVLPFRDGNVIPVDKQWPYDTSFFPSEGLISNVVDLCSWINLVLLTDPAILNKSSYKTMLTPRVETADKNAKIGLAWFTKENKNLMAYHLGGIRGYESILVIYPEKKQAIIALTNSSDVPRWDIVEIIEETFKPGSN